MATETQLIFGEDKSLAERNKEDGMQASIEHADREIKSWSEMAYEMLKKFLSLRNEEEFLAEEARAWAHKSGLVNPPSERAWGAVIRRAATQGLISFSGYAKTTNPKAHRTPAALWRKKIIKIT